MEDDKEYQVCANLKQKIEAAQTPRKSQQMNPEATVTVTIDINNGIPHMYKLYLQLTTEIA